MRRVAIDPIQTAEPVPPVRLCDHPGCEAGGDFRAPRSRIELDNYFWFCLDHVRAYNAAWNYYAGMNEAEIEAEIRHDTTWQRPTWKLGERHGPAYEARMRDPFGSMRKMRARRGNRAARGLPAPTPRPRRLGARAGAGGVRHRPALHPNKPQGTLQGAG